MKIMIISPSRSLAMIGKENVKFATERLQNLGFEVVVSKNAYKKDEFISSSVFDRVSDMHDAFKSKEIEIIMAGLGGYNCNQLIDHIDYDIIKANPKKIFGYSDITVLLNAIYCKTGLITYLGPTFNSFAMKMGLKDTIESFKKAVKDEPYSISDPNTYSSDKWYLDQSDRMFIKNSGMKCLNEGEATGIIVGGNLCSFNLLQGTEYMPSLENKIIFIEDDDLVGSAFSLEFDRNFQSLIHQENFNKVKGLVVGRCEEKIEMSIQKWKKILLDKEELKGIPIIIDANFGHTTPMATIPIGGKCTIKASKENSEILIWERATKDN